MNEVVSSGWNMYASNTINVCLSFYLEYDVLVCEQN